MPRRRRPARKTHFVLHIPHQDLWRMGANLATVALVLFVTASNFDESEVKTLGVLAGAMTAVEKLFGKFTT